MAERAAGEASLEIVRSSYHEYNMGLPRAGQPAINAAENPCPTARNRKGIDMRHIEMRHAAMRHTVCCIALVLLLAVCCAVSATDPAVPIPAGDGPAAGQYVVQIRILRSGNDGSKAVLAEPTLIVPANRPASFRSGGEQTAGDEQVPLGTAARLTITEADDGQVLVVGMVENSETVDRGNGVLSRHSDEAYFKKTVALGKTSRLQLSNTADASQWIELTVKAAEELAATRQAAPATQR
jgi:hypothetical protein